MDPTHEDDPGELVEAIADLCLRSESSPVLKQQFRDALIKLIDERIEANIGTPKPE